MSDILLLTISFMLGAAFGGELCCYFATPSWFRREHQLLGFTPFLGGFLIYRKWKGRGRG